MIIGASDSNDIIEKITSGLSNMLFNIRPTVLPGCAASISFTPEVTSSVGVAKVGALRVFVCVLVLDERNSDACRHLLQHMLVERENREEDQRSALCTLTALQGN